MSKKKNDPQKLLVRAEKAFAEGNYSLAKNEYTKLLRLSPELDVEEKIRICQSELQKDKAKYSIKRAWKCLNKNRPDQALLAFKEAQELDPQPWIEEKIAELEGRVQTINVGERARDAECKGEFKEAARLYQQVFQDTADSDALLGMASCLVRGEDYTTAITAFEMLLSAEPDLILSPAALYDYGFSLAMDRRFYDCFRIWDSLELQDPTFHQQKEEVLMEYIADLFHRAAEGAESIQLYHELTYVKQLLEWRNQYFGTTELSDYVKYRVLEKLWSDGDYQKIAEIITTDPLPQEGELIIFSAKVFLKAAEQSPQYLVEAISWGLTSLYNGKSTPLLADSQEMLGPIRNKLIPIFHNLVEKHIDEGSVDPDKIRSILKNEEKSVNDLHAIFCDDSELSGLICTPLHAENFHLSEAIRSNLRKNRKKFPTEEAYLLSGCYYSSLRKHLYHLDFSDCRQTLAELENSEVTDEFSDFGHLIARYYLILYMLETGQKLPKDSKKTMIKIADKSPLLLRDFLDKANRPNTIEFMKDYEILLGAIQQVHQTPEINHVLSHCISTRAIRIYNTESASSKSLLMQLEKALQLDPDNEFALDCLDDIEEIREIEEMEEAFDKYKLHRAATIASETIYEAVEERFFSNMEDYLEDIKRGGQDPEIVSVFLYEMYNHCSFVDSEHPIVARLKEMLE